MHRYLIISPHTHEECKNAISQVLSAGYTTHFDWGCMDEDHTGWVILEAEDAKQALMVVPAFLRGKARAVKLTRFDQKGEPILE
jgi:hypothetical protein